MLAPGSGSGGGGGSSGSGGGGGGVNTNTDAHIQHNLDTLNMYRAQHGADPLVLDDALSAFSATAAEKFLESNMAHGYFMQQGSSGAIWTQGFCNSAAENQAPGWPTTNGLDDTIDKILKAMMDEGPGGGHYENIIAPSSTRVGVGLVLNDQQELWFSNDFSGACR
jgi:uncharacterized protein YkwD